MTAARESGEFDAYGNRTRAGDTTPPPPGHPTPIVITLICPPCEGSGDRMTVSGVRATCEVCEGFGRLTPKELAAWAAKHHHAGGGS